MTNENIKGETGNGDRLSPFRPAVKRRPYAWGVLVGLILLGGIALLLSSGPGSVARLADGTELRLLGVSIGTNWFSTELPWHKTARRVLPRQFQHLIPLPIRARCGYEKGLTVWVQLYDPARNTNLVQNWGRLESVSAKGESLRAGDGGSGCSSGMNARYHAYSLLNFPRRQRSFLLRFYDRNQQLAATLRVPNPYRGPYPEWKADPLPVTKTNGGLAVTFKGISKLWEEFPPGKTNTHLRAQFDLQWQGLPTKEWRQTWSLLTDPPGNWIGGLFVGLPESEPVWRLQQGFCRTEDARFTPEEYFVITNLAVPAPGSYTNLNLFTNLQGIGLCLFTWTGPAVLTFSNGAIIDAAPPQKNEQYWSQVWWRSEPTGLVTANNFGRPALLVAQDGAGLDYEVRFVFRDEQGQRIGMMNKMPGGFIYDMVQNSPAKAFLNNQFRPMDFVLQPEIPAGTKSVSLDVIVQRVRALEFFVEPPRTGKWIGR